jgi:hypothetical protein
VSDAPCQVRPADASDAAAVADLASELAQSFSFARTRFDRSYPALGRGSLRRWPAPRPRRRPGPDERLRAVGGLSGLRAGSAGDPAGSTLLSRPGIRGVRDLPPKDSGRPGRAIAGSRLVRRRRRPECGENEPAEAAVTSGRGAPVSMPFLHGAMWTGARGGISLPSRPRSNMIHGKSPSSALGSRRSSRSAGMMAGHAGDTERGMQKRMRVLAAPSGWR